MRHAPQMPAHPKPIVIIGAGGIVNDAHMPAYRKAGYDVIGIFDTARANAEKTANRWGIAQVFASLQDAVQYDKTAVFDVALPPAAIADTLRQLPDGAVVLIQKPMGENMQQALQIRTICRRKNFISAINFQLRFSPQMLQVQEMITQGQLGALLEVDMTANIHTLWHLFPFLKGMERVEIAVHSIHYLDLIRAFVGDPISVFCRTMGDARCPDMAQTRTSAILDYGHTLRCLMSINHNHNYQDRFQHAQLRIEGTKGGIITQIGAVMAYPNGAEDKLWFAPHGGDWQSLPLNGTWFPDAFIGRMHNIQQFANGETDTLIASTEDAIKTMALVEACFVSNTCMGTPLASV